MTMAHSLQNERVAFFPVVYHAKQCMVQIESFCANIHSASHLLLYASHDFKCFLQVLASCLIHNTNFRKQTFVNDGRGINTNSAPRVWTYSEDLM